MMFGILRDLTVAIRGLREQVEAIQTDQQARQADDNQQPVQPIRIDVISVPEPHAAITKYFESRNHDRQTIWFRHKAKFAVFGVVVGLAIAIFNLLTLIEIQKQTPKITQSAETEIEDMHRAHRPWAYVPISGGITTVKPLEFDPLQYKAHSSVSYSIKNEGTSPALNTARAYTLVIGEAQILLTGAQKYSPCERSAISTLTKVLGFFIGPGDSIMAGPDEVFNNYPFSKIGEVGAVLQICIGYRDEFETVHGTGSAWRYITDQGKDTFEPEGVIAGEWKFYGLGNVSY
jgi:hypothetical protein